MTPFDKFLKHVSDEAYFKAHPKVLVALSGGLDSMTLFNWLYEARDLLQIDLSVAHVNHGQRRESDDEASALMTKMAELGIPFYKARFKGPFSEAKARQFRYDFFEQVMVEQGITALVTAHHQDDVRENFMIRLIRGSRLRHLSGMKAVQSFGHSHQGFELIRPLLTFDKTELDANVFYEDASNAGDDYLRNRVRNQYLQLLSQENINFAEHLSSLTSEIEKAMSIVTYSARAYANQDRIDLIEFSREIEALQYFILQDYIAKFPLLTVSKPQFNELLHLIQREGQYFHAISNDYNFVKDHHHFYIEERSRAREFETSLTPYATGYFNAIDLPSHGQIVLRKRQAGDRIQVNGLSKKLRRYFIDSKVPLQKRGNPLVVVDNLVYGVLDVVTTDLSKSLKHDRMKRTLYYREKG